MDQHLIARPRVERLLRDAVTHAQLTFVHAPLGAGKSAAAALALAGDTHTAWFEAEPWHRGAFVAGMVDAVRAVRPTFGRLTLGAVEASAQAAHLGGTFSADLQHLEESLTIVVDNVHVFDDDPTFMPFVDAAIRALPPSVRVLALGRSLPASGFARAAAANRIAVLDGAFLALDDDELAAFVRESGRTLDASDMRRLKDATQGWAAGTSLALQAWPLDDALNAAHGIAQAYFNGRLLPDLGRHDTRALEELSIFETIDLALLEHDATLRESAARVAALLRSGAPIAELGDGRYRVHPLLRELALTRLHKRGGANAAHAAAALAYARGGSIAAALHHAGTAGDAAAATAVLRTHAAAAIATGDRIRVAALLRLIDPDGPDADVYWYVSALMHKAEASTATRSTFARAAHEAAASGDRAIEFGARAQLFEYDIGHLASVSGDALQQLQEHAQPLGQAAQGNAAVLRGWAHAVAHEFRSALGCVEPFANVADAASRFDADVLRAYALTSLGDIDAAQDTLDALTHGLENDDRAVLQTLSLIWFARLALLWGHTDAAWDAAAQAERLAGVLDLRAEEAALFMALAEIATHRGDVGATVRYAERARSRARHAWYAADVGRAQAFSELSLARAAFLGHDNAIARDIALRGALAPDASHVQRALALCEASFYTLLHEPAAAVATIDRTREALFAARPLDAADAVALSVVDDLLAFLDAANGLTHESRLSGCGPFAALIAQRRGLVNLELAGIAVGNARRGATDGSTALETAIATITAHGPRFETRLVRAYALSFVRPRHREQPPAMPVDLTVREREILVLLVDGLSNKEIAQRLVVSPRTIETHVERVLGKLEVGSRSRAIAKAIRVGLVRLD